MWDKELPEIKKWQDVEEDYVPLSSIPEDIQKEGGCQAFRDWRDHLKDIKPEMTLALNLGLDSLDMAELVVFLQDQYDVSGVLVPDLTTVNKLMAYAAKKIVPNEVSAEPLKISKKWEIKGSRKRSFIAPGKTMRKRCF